MREPLDQAEPPAENSPRTATVGRPFEKGVSGNPGGRKKGLASRVRETIGDDGESLVGFWGAVLSGELRTQRTVVNAKGEPTGEKETTYEPVSIGDRLAVSKILAERGWGRPAEFVPIDDSDPLDLELVQDESIAERLERRCDEIADARRRRDAREAARQTAGG
jgi:hypothetical protein